MVGSSDGRDMGEVASDGKDAYPRRQERIAATLIGHAGDDGMIRCRYRQCQGTIQEWRS
jgi:hypothetical protein